MSVRHFNLPVCDVCGEPWLPNKRSVYKGISARLNPRAFDEARRKEHLAPLRCGKCKSPGWDSQFHGAGLG